VRGASSNPIHWALVFRFTAEPSIPVKAGLKTLKLNLLKIRLDS
jgi:hypothetical protein